MNKRKLLVIFSISYFLIACGVAPKPQDKKPDLNVPDTLDLRTQEQKSLDDIEAQYLQNSDIDARNLSLLNLADYYKDISNCPASDTIIAALQSSIDNAAHLGFASLLKAECTLQKLNQTNDGLATEPQLKLLENWVNTARTHNMNSSVLPPAKLGNGVTDLRTRTHIASAQLLAQNAQYQDALVELFKVNITSTFAGQAQSTAALYNYAWQWFSKADDNTRATLANKYPVLSEYKVIFDIIQSSDIDDSDRQASIRQWLMANPNQLSAQYLPSQVERYLAITRPENQNIAVLLPLSGRLSAQGEAIKQGILSAYYNKAALAQENGELPSTRIEFIDTGSVQQMSVSVSNETLANFDTIIGPLLRSHIEQMDDFDLSQKHQIVLNQTQFHKNQDESTELMQVSFALAPEQEAKQLAELMRASNISNPILIDDGSGTAQRMKTAFVDSWEASQVQHSGRSRALPHIQYSDNKSMRVGITAALDVLQSERRINQLSNLQTETVHSVTRNRRDIDAFVIFARPNDVELINPIIESSISLFTNDHIPVFATSYGYDHKQSKNSQRDLRNLVFVDMPWLLSQGQEESLRRSVDKLFNEPPSTFLRLFAFGHDAYALVDNLAQLTTFSHLSVTGLSGDLSVDNTQQLVRKLSSLSINNTNL